MIVNRFETVFADTPAARDLHYSVRYRVFCEEAGFEDPSQFPDHREQDAFDEHAAQFIIWDRLEREWVGASRFVPATAPSMPCEDLCESSLQYLDERRNRAAEFSRLCVLSKLRRTEQGFRFGMLGPDGLKEGREAPVFFRQEEHEIFVRLLWASLAWGMANGVDFFYCLIHRALARLLARFGMLLDVVGDPVKHRGTRVPHCYEVHSTEGGMSLALPTLVSRLKESGAFVSYSAFVGQSPELSRPDVTVHALAARAGAVAPAAVIGGSRASAVANRVA
jgi:N-acyl amino acid synthase of PEP-CTERM/exosortase system